MCVSSTPGSTPGSTGPVIPEKKPPEQKKGASIFQFFTKDIPMLANELFETLRSTFRPREKPDQNITTQIGQTLTKELPSLAKEAVSIAKDTFETLKKPDQNITTLMHHTRTEELPALAKEAVSIAKDTFETLKKPDKKNITTQIGQILTEDLPALVKGAVSIAKDTLKTAFTTPELMVFANKLSKMENISAKDMNDLYTKFSALIKKPSSQEEKRQIVELWDQLESHKEKITQKDFVPSEYVELSKKIEEFKTALPKS